jgi:hypothetical protein
VFEMRERVDRPRSKRSRESMRQYGATVLSLLLSWPIAAAAAPVLLLDEPQQEKQLAKYRVTILNEGLGVIRLKPAVAGASLQRVTLSVSPFKAAGQTQPAFVGFDDGDSGPVVPYLAAFDIGPEGTEVRLNGSGLSPDLEYGGELSATIGTQQRLTWDLTLVRPGQVAPFICPSGPQILLPNGALHLTLLPAVAFTAGAANVSLTPFTSSDFQLADLGLVPKAGAAPVQVLANQPLQERSLHLTLRAAGLTEGTSYSGRFSVQLASQPRMTCPLEIVMPRTTKSELLTDTTSITESVTLAFLGLGGSGPAAVTVYLSEKSGARLVESIAATLDGSSESPHGRFEASRHLSFAIDGTEVPDLMRVSASEADRASNALRKLLPGERRAIEMRFRDLSAGKHAFGLKFVAANSVIASPKVDVVLNVRHHILWALVAVAGALLLSYIISKGIVHWRERIRFANRIRQLRVERFDAYSDLPSVAFLHAVLAQSDKLLARRRLLPPPQSVSDYLTRAERVVTILRRYSSLTSALERASFEDRIKHHYREAIADVMHQIGPRPLDQPTTDRIVEELAAIAGRLNEPRAWYWTTLKTKAAHLHAAATQVKSKLGNQGTVDRLLELLAAPAEKPTADYDAAYWIVRVLYERRSDQNAIKKLHRAYAVNSQLEDLTRTADEQAWTGLKEAVTQRHVSVAPFEINGGPEALRPIKFVVNFADSALAESYLVRHLIKYRWTFTLRGDHASLTWRQRFANRIRPLLKGTPSSPPSKIWSQTLEGPRITQYAPHTGTLRVDLTMRWKTQELAVAPVDQTIQKNTELTLLKSLDSSEILLMFLVALITLGTSLPALYFAKGTFGSFTDYVAILAWAIGIDQGKNLIQMLKTYPADAATS